MGGEHKVIEISKNIQTVHLFWEAVVRPVQKLDPAEAGPQCWISFQLAIIELPLSVISHDIAPEAKIKSTFLTLF